MTIAHAFRWRYLNTGYGAYFLTGHYCTIARYVAMNMDLGMPIDSQCTLLNVGLTHIDWLVRDGLMLLD